jgi:hypothetical protein
MTRGARTDPPGDGDATRSLTETAYLTIREQLLSGLHAPQSKLRIDEHIVRAFSTSMPRYRPCVPSSYRRVVINTWLAAVAARCDTNKIASQRRGRRGLG